MDRITAIASIEYVREKCQILGEQESPHDFFGTICEALSMAIEALQEPQVGGWIPVSERLPEDGYGVLVTVNGKHNHITFENALEIAEYDSEDGWIIEGYLDWTNPDVTAWQPLPEPYKEERTNDSRNQQRL